MTHDIYMVEPIGFIRCSLVDPADAPHQGDEGAPAAWLEMTPAAAPGMAGIGLGDELIILTWLHLAQRDMLQVHPRGEL